MDKKKNALYHKTLKINVNDLNCIGFVHTFFPFLFLCPSINFFYSLNDDKHMHVAVSIFFFYGTIDRADLWIKEKKK